MISIVALLVCYICGIISLKLEQRINAGICFIAGSINIPFIVMYLRTRW